MLLTLTWREIAIRLAWSFAAGLLIGINRTERGRSAGMRTTILVCLAAAMAMILANLLLGTRGRQPDAFVNLDVMRLPLGVLSGMGFIGAGAILRREKMTSGVTTAATLWFITLVGLSFGSGQIALGAVTLALGLAVLWIMYWVESWMHRDRLATLTVAIRGEGLTDADLRAILNKSGYKVVNWDLSLTVSPPTRIYCCAVGWHGPPVDHAAPSFIAAIAAASGVYRVTWKS